MTKHAVLRRPQRTMESILRASILQRNQVLKRQREASKKNYKEEWLKQWRAKIQRNRVLSTQAKNERISRREDWELGPLAPKRNVGEEKGIYGATDPTRLHYPQLLEPDKRKYHNIVAGDRCVVVRGRGTGRIGTVTQVNEDEDTVTVEDVMPIEVKVPKFIQQGQQGQKPTRQYDEPVPIEDVRLVVAMDIGGTGDLKEVVVRYLRGGDPVIEREYGDPTPSHTRYIQLSEDGSADLEVPWPTVDPREEIDEDVDTLRQQVEALTFIPSLVELPTPPSVIDELRNKYSRTKERYDVEFMNEKKLLDAKKIWQSRQRLISPKSELQEKRQREKAEVVKQGLSSETIELIRKTQKAQGLQPADIQPHMMLGFDHDLQRQGLHKNT